MNCSPAPIRTTASSARNSCCRNSSSTTPSAIVSTHDLALTQIPALFGERAANYHFEDRIEDGRLSFDYKLKPGIVQTSNALKLMRAIGLGVTD